MKIMFNCLTMEKGGAERVISIISNKMVKDNDIAICMLKNTNIFYNLDKKIQIFKIDKTEDNKKNKIQKIISRFSIIRIIKHRKIIINYKPDIIISFLPEPSFRVMLLKRASKKIKQIPVIVSIRNDPNREYKNILVKNIMKYLYKKLDGLVLQTNEAKDFFDNILPKKINSIVIPNPIDELFLVDKPYHKNREKYIVTVGRIEKQKNHKLLIDAFEKYMKINNTYKLKIYGDGTLKKELQEYISKKELQNSVFLMGSTTDVKNSIYKASCFVLSSDYEGMPNSLMEALALGVPCISTDCPCGGPKYLIENQKNGFLCDINDSEKLYQLLKYVLSENNKEVIKKISIYSCEKSKAYSIDNITNKWMDYINKIINKERI